MHLKMIKIAYRDGSTQMVKATVPVPDGTWLVFADGTGEILRVPAADVHSVSDPEKVGDREQPGPNTA